MGFDLVCFGKWNTPSSARGKSGQMMSGKRMRGIRNRSGGLRENVVQHMRYCQLISLQQPPGSQQMPVHVCTSLHLASCDKLCATLQGRHEESCRLSIGWHILSICTNYGHILLCSTVQYTYKVLLRIDEIFQARFSGAYGRKFAFYVHTSCLRACDRIPTYS